MQAVYISKGDNLAEALSVQPGITALVGGGGKTTLMYALADALSGLGRVIVTTSTHIFSPAHLPVLSADDTQELTKVFSKHPIICVGKPDGHGKLTGGALSPQELLHVCDYVLVEADGAKRLPLKAPAPHEPVIPQGTAHVIAVAGLDGVGRPIREAAFRADRYAALLSKSPDAGITPKDAAFVLQHPEGQRKGALDSMRFSVLLNKADTPQRRAYGEQIAAYLDEKLVSKVLITALTAL